MSPFEGVGSSTPPPLSDAAYAAVLLAIDPGLVGVRVRGWSGPARDAWIRDTTCLHPTAPVRKMPLGISDDRLLGGLDLAATLAAGRAISGAGILAESENGFLVVAMAERLTPSIAAHLAAAIDAEAGITLIALDEGIGPDETPPAALVERLAFTVTADIADTAIWPAPPAIAAASRAVHQIECTPQVIERVCALAALMGVKSVRAELFTIRAGRAAAALRGSTSIEDDDIDLAARLVLVPRATQMPSSSPPERETPEPSQQQNQAEGDTPDKPLEDKVDDAAASMLPANLLEALAAHFGPRRIVRGAGKTGATPSTLRGRPVGARPGQLTGRSRLSILDTLRAAAPWQRVRRASPGTESHDPARAAKSDSRAARRLPHPPLQGAGSPHRDLRSRRPPARAPSTALPRRKAQSCSSSRIAMCSGTRWR